MKVTTSRESVMCEWKSLWPSAGGRYPKKSRRGGGAYTGAQGVASELDGELGDGVATEVKRRECIKVQASTGSQRLAGE